MIQILFTAFALVLSPSYFNEAYALDPGPSTTVLPDSALPQSAGGIPILPQDRAGVSEMVRSDGFELQWWRDEQTHKINFRRCRSKYGRTFCEAPMLLNGMDEQELPKFMAYYSERLEHWGSGHLTALTNALTGSLGTAAAYVGTFAAINVFKGALPASANKMLESVVVRGGVHLVSVGTLGVLVYFTAKNLHHLTLQKKLRRQFEKVETGDYWNLPVDLSSRSLFEEFVSTFRRALYEYTHGGPPFDDSDNLIFQ